MITGTAIGSFGFEFELPFSAPALFEETDKAKEAMVRIKVLFRVVANGIIFRVSFSRQEHSSFSAFGTKRV